MSIDTVAQVPLEPEPPKRLGARERLRNVWANGAGRGWLLVAPALLAVAIVLVVPILSTIGSTFTQDAGVLAPYERFLGSGFRRAVLWRTVEIALITTVISLAVGFCTALTVSRMGGRWRSVLIIAAVFPLLTNTVVRSFAWMIVLGKNGMINDTLLWLGVIGEPLTMLYTKGAVIVGLVYLFTPLMILSLVGVLENIDHDLTDAAASLGAGPAAVFRQVTFPLAVPGLIVGSVLVFTGAFTAYVTPALMGGTRQTVLATLMYQRAMVSFDWTAASTIAAIMTVITIAIVLIMGRLARAVNPAAT